MRFSGRCIFFLCSGVKHRKISDVKKPLTINFSKVGYICYETCSVTNPSKWPFFLRLTQHRKKPLTNYGNKLVSRYLKMTFMLTNYNVKCQNIMLYVLLQYIYHYNIITIMSNYWYVVIGILVMTCYYLHVVIYMYKWILYYHTILVTYPCHIPLSPTLVTYPCHIPLSHTLVTYPCHLPLSHTLVTSNNQKRNNSNFTNIELCSKTLYAFIHCVIILCSRRLYYWKNW